MSSHLGVKQIFGKANDITCFMTFSSRNRSEYELPTVTQRTTLTTRAEYRINGTIIMHCCGESHDLHRVFLKKKKACKRTDN